MWNILNPCKILVGNAHSDRPRKTTNSLKTEGKKSITPNTLSCRAEKGCVFAFVFWLDYIYY
jgi:hypothetical protein